MKKNRTAIRAQGTTAEVLIYEEIGEGFFGGLGAKEFRQQISALPKDITSMTVRINSDGGSVFDGFAIYNTLKDHPAKKNVIIDGIAASIASVIAMAGDTITIQPTATLMIHNASATARGDCNGLREIANILETMNGQMALAYARSGKDEKDILAIMNTTTWYTAQQAVDAGWADGLVATPLRMAASLKDFDFSAESVPDWVKIAAAASPDSNEACTCDCAPCMAGDCADCSVEDCTFEGCMCASNTEAKTKDLAEKTAKMQQNQAKVTEITDFAIAARVRDRSLRLADLS